MSAKEKLSVMKQFYDYTANQFTANLELSQDRRTLHLKNLKTGVFEVSNRIDGGRVIGIYIKDNKIVFGPPKVFEKGPRASVKLAIRDDQRAIRGPRPPFIKINRDQDIGYGRSKFTIIGEDIQTMGRVVMDDMEPISRQVQIYNLRYVKGETSGDEYLLLEV